MARVNNPRTSFFIGLLLPEGVCPGNPNMMPYNRPLGLPRFRNGAARVRKGAAGAVFPAGAGAGETWRGRPRGSA